MSFWLKWILSASLWASLSAWGRETRLKCSLKECRVELARKSWPWMKLVRSTALWSSETGKGCLWSASFLCWLCSLFGMKLEQIKQDSSWNPQMTLSLKWCWDWKRFSSLAFYSEDNVFLLGKETLGGKKRSPPDCNTQVIGIWPEIWSYENSPSTASHTPVSAFGLTLPCLPFSGFQRSG